MAAPRPYRTRYVAKLRRPPESWHPDWLSRMDQRFRNLAIVRAQLAALEADLSAGEPEALSWVERRLANHLVWADTMAEDLERQFSRGEEVDTARFAALLSVIVRLAQLVGTKRRAKPVPRLEDLLADHKRQSAA